MELLSEMYTEEELGRICETDIDALREIRKKCAGRRRMECGG